ncbi:MAG: dihydroneopterin aldolase [Myxococcales bacterium]|nr:dihydroneopterin aldolase [Myxococcales bacterium]
MGGAHIDHVQLDLELACIVGILPRERIEPQALSISLCMGMDLDPCGTTGDLEAGVDYGAVDSQVRYLCTEGRFRLIEVLGVALLRLVLAPPGPGEARAPLAWASVQIRKPSVLRSAVPGVFLRRDAPWAGDGLALADVREVTARRVVLPASSTLEGSPTAMLLDAAPRVVQLPYEASEACTLLQVCFHE